MRKIYMRKVALYRLALAALSLATAACASLGEGMNARAAAAASAPLSAAPPPPHEGAGIPLDEALSAIAAYYAESLPANTKIALLPVESEARLLSDYIFEELWIQFEDRSSFALVDRQNLEPVAAARPRGGNRRYADGYDARCRGAIYL